MSTGDRFRDLGRRGRRGAPAADGAELGIGPEGGAADRLADLDRQEPPPEPPPPPRPGSRYSWVVGVAALIAIVVAGANVVRTEGPGAGGLERGRPLPVFAAPLAAGGADADANVKQDEDDPGRRLACDVRGPRIVNICELRRKPLVLTFLFTRGADCEPQLDRIERLRRDFPDVNFAGVIIREPREQAERLVRDHGWGFPVALDRDGVLSNLYGVAVCPTTTFAERGGRVRETRTGNLTDAQLRRSIAALLSGERPPRR